MGIRRYNPTSPGRRQATVSDFADLTPGAKPAKHLRVPKHGTGGRNNQGKITSRHRGGGHKRAYRLIDFRRNKDGIVARVNSIQYDPNRRRADRLAALCRRREALHPGPGRAEGGRPGPERRVGLGGRGQLLAAGEDSPGDGRPQYRDAPGRGGVLCRSAGARATLAARDADWAQINLPSGEIRRVPATCRATIGTLGNADHMGIVLGKAGRKRWMGRRPHVRGTAMNPIDHPHGGGEGRTKGGRHPVSPTGKLAKGGFTRKRRKPSSKAIVRRRRSRRYGQLKIR